MENPEELMHLLDKLGKGKVIIAPRVSQAETTEALHESRQMIQEKAGNYERNKIEKSQKSPYDPEFDHRSSLLPPGPTEMADFNEANPQVLGHIVAKLGEVNFETDSVRVEYLGHKVYETRLNGSVGKQYIFRFRSRIKDVQGKIQYFTFYPSFPGTHSPARGGHYALDRWLKQIRKIETGSSKADSEQWYTEKETGYFRYSCFVPNKLI